MNCQLSWGYKDVINFHLRHWTKKVPVKYKLKLNKMLARCFNPQLARGRVQSSDWPAQNQARFKYDLYTVIRVAISATTFNKTNVANQDQT